MLGIMTEGRRSRPRTGRFAAIGVTTMFLLAACSASPGSASPAASSEAEAPSVSVEPSESAEATESAEPTPEPHARAEERTKVDVNLAFLPQGRNSPLYYGVAEGIYEDHNLDVTITPASGTAAGLQQLIAGNSQFILGDLSATLKAMGESPDPKMTAYGVIYAKAAQTIFFFDGGDISEPKDLEGKTIATSQGSNEFNLFPLFAEANDIVADAVQWQVVDARIKVGLLLQGTVDATSTTLFGLAQLEAGAQPGQEIGYFMYGDHGVNLYGASLVARDDYAAENPDVVAAFVEATFEAYQAGLDNPEEAVAAMKAAVPELDEAVALAEMQIMPQVMIGDAQEENGLGWMDPAMVESTYDSVIAEGVSLPLPFDDYFSNDYLPGQ